MKFFIIIKRDLKAIKSIDEEKHQLKIADVFDTRQNPDKIERKK
jgi:toxin ParE1/3/4